MIDIWQDILRLHRIQLKQKGSVLAHLLEDKTTGRHILWATEAYAAMGDSFACDREIEERCITGNYSGVIKTRAQKGAEQKNDRTRKRGEVFTPVWVCRMMNDFADEEWFGGKNVFFENGAPTDRVLFPRGKTWQQYIDSRRLEITCGEAPYLVSRYDTETGEEIPLRERAGILDRKLRAVSENAETPEEWKKWAMRAVEATYGYEFQGDSLLIARINVLATYEEYLYARFGEAPTIQEYARLSTVIPWNIWQMNGLTDSVPYAKSQYGSQISIEQLMNVGAGADEQDRSLCRVCDWRSKTTAVFKDMKKS